MAKTIQNGSFRDPLGNVLNAGRLELYLSQEAHEKVGGQIAPTKVSITLNATGDVPATSILANDELDPDGTSYRAVAFNAAGSRVYGPVTWVLSGGSPIELDDIIPTSVSVSAISPVPSTRNINTTAPLTGGGDLSVDRTHVLTGAPATKGNLYSFSTEASSEPIGSNERLLVADSAGTRGLRWGALRNISATVAPVVTDDSASGYEVGSFWLDVTADRAYVAVDVSVGTAVWKQIDATQYSLQAFSHTSHTATASTTFFIGGNGAIADTNASRNRIYIPRTGTITAWRLYVRVGGTLAGAGTANLWVRVNDTTDNLNIQVSFTSADVTGSATGSVSVTAGDFFQIKLTTPGWSPDPSTVHYLASILIE